MRLRISIGDVNQTGFPTARIRVSRVRNCGERYLTRWDGTKPFTFSTDLRYFASPIAENVNPNGTERGTGNDLVRFQFVVIAKLVHAL